MFKDSSALDRSRTAASFAQAQASYKANAEKWYHGTVDSVDARLGACISLLHRARSICGRYSINDAGRYLHAAEALEADHRALIALREDLLNGAAGREDVTGPPGWRSANRPGNWYGGTDEEAAGLNPHGMHPNDYTSFDEYNNASNMRSYLQEQSHKFPGAGDHPVGDPGTEATDPKYRGKPNPVPTSPQQPPPNAMPGADQTYQRRKQKRMDADPSWAKAVNANLSGTDQRWVTLEASKFVAANTDCLDDSHELATRAHHYATLKTSTFNQVHSAAVSRAFVATVTDLGAQSYRPPVRETTAAFEDFEPEAMFL